MQVGQKVGAIMKITWHSLYMLVLGLWVGGMAIFTFIVTPVLFRSFSRDQAGVIVGRLFPGYFLYILILAALAFMLFLVAASDHSRSASRISFAFLIAALIMISINTFKLYPETIRIKQQISAFETESSDSAARKQFARLHALSASLNLLLLVDGIALLLVGPALRR